MGASLEQDRAEGNRAVGHLIYITATFLTTKIIVLSPFKDQLWGRGCRIIQFLSEQGN